MNDEKQPWRKRAMIGAATVLTAVTVAGGAVAVSSAATAATTTPSTSSSSSTSTTVPKNFNPGGSAPVRHDEKAVSSADSATLSAAALKAVPGATIIRVETDSGDAAYEVHLTKPDGTLATVKFDKSLTVTKVETGMGQGDPRPAGGPGKGHMGQGDLRPAGGPGKGHMGQGDQRPAGAPANGGMGHGQPPTGNSPGHTSGNNTGGLGNFGA
jgi:uncharacterized membrane protein YkoI